MELFNGSAHSARRLAFIRILSQQMNTTFQDDVVSGVTKWKFPTSPRGLRIVAKRPYPSECRVILESIIGKPKYVGSSWVFEDTGGNRNGSNE